MAHATNTFYFRGALGTTVNSDIIGGVWTGEFDLNTPGDRFLNNLRVDGYYSYDNRLNSTPLSPDLSPLLSGIS